MFWILLACILVNNLLDFQRRCRRYELLTLALLPWVHFLFVLLLSWFLAYVCTPLFPVELKTGASNLPSKGWKLKVPLWLSNFFFYLFYQQLFRTRVSKTECFSKFLNCLAFILFVLQNWKISLFVVRLSRRQLPEDIYSLIIFSEGYLALDSG